MNKNSTNTFHERVLNQQLTHGYTNEDVMNFLKYLEILDSETILDIGCGEGKIGFTALNLNPTIKLISMDYKQNQLNEAKQNFEETKSKGTLFNIDFKQGSLTESRLPDNSINKIIAKMVLHEIPKSNQKIAIKEMYRILKPGGKLGMRFVDLNNENQKEFQEIAREKDKLAGFQELVTNRYFFTKEELYSYCNEAGFSKIEDKDRLNFIFDPDKYLLTDFEGDKSKLDKLKIKIYEILHQKKNIFQNDDYRLNIGFRIVICSK